MSDEQSNAGRDKYDKSAATDEARRFFDPEVWETWCDGVLGTEFLDSDPDLPAAVLSLLDFSPEAYEPEPELAEAQRVMTRRGAAAALDLLLMWGSLEEADASVMQGAAEVLFDEVHSWDSPTLTSAILNDDEWRYATAAVGEQWANERLIAVTGREMEDVAGCLCFAADDGAAVVLIAYDLLAKSRAATSHLLRR